MKYEFANAVFTPQEKIKLTIEGKGVKLSKQQTKLLQLFLEHPKKKFSKDDLIERVWGEGEHSHSAVFTAISRLNARLPQLAKIESVEVERGSGYQFNIVATKVAFRYKKLEQKLTNSLHVNALFVVLLLITVFLGFNTYQWLNPPPTFETGVQTPIFTRDYVVQYPQLSPDGQYIAHKLSKEMFKQDYLGLIEVKRQDTRPLVPMGFLGAFKWSLTGDSIVYQNITAEKCEIRLLSFNDDKSQFTDKHIIDCAINSGALSFAWFSDNQFYVNLVEGDGTTNNSLLPQHQLYSINIDTLEVIKEETLNDHTGLGFYSLEYDASINTLYLLKTNHFVSTDIYRYKNSNLEKIGTLDWVVRFYVASNNRLIFKTPSNDLVVNFPADDFANQTNLLSTARDPISQIHGAGDSITFLVGDTYYRSVKKWLNGKTQPVNLADFEPRLIARYNNQLVFSSNSTQSYQVYLIADDGTPQQISDFDSNEPIQHIEVTNDIFAISYTNKVEIYRYQHNRLQWMTSLTDYTHGVVSDDGKRILVTDLSQGEQSTPVVELNIANQTTTGVQLVDAKFAFYHNQQVVYVNYANELIRLIDGKHLVLGHNVNARFLKATSLYQDKLYYVQRKPFPDQIVTINLIDGSRSTITHDFMNLRKIEVIDGQLHILAWQTLKPSIYVSDVIRKQ